jgi:hypothetical protein
LKHERREQISFTETNKNKRKIYYLGSNHGRGIGPMLQENLGSKFDICSIFKPNARLAKFVEDLGKLGKDLTKQDNISIVRGPGNSLDRNHHYSIEDDLNYIAKRTSKQMCDLLTSFRGTTSHGRMGGLEA